MAMPNRWIVATGDTAPVTQVALRTLRQRLAVVWLELAHAGTESVHHPERVHQLRVATRRALVAIHVFADLIPDRRRRWFEKRLRSIRRTAGEARDLDVLTQRLFRSQQGPPNLWLPGHAKQIHARLLAMLERQRIASRSPIRRLHQTLQDADWSGRVAAMLERVARAKQIVSFRVYARQRFKPMIEDFFDIAGHKLRDAGELHALRIEGKNLRYALEIFAAAIPESSRVPCYEQLEQLQEHLGAFTDHATAADRFKTWSRAASARSIRALLRTMHEEEKEMAHEARRGFSRWWNRSRRRSLRRRLDRSLRRTSA